MKQKKKLMVLGASYSQIPLMEAARSLGCEVITVSVPGPYLGFSHADTVVYADITDPEAVLKAAQTEQIDGITTCCMDLGIEAMGYVNEKLGLPGPGFAAAKAARNKALEKEAYRKAGVRTARFAFVHSEEDLEEAMKELSFPVILKAVDQMGSRGIQRADTAREAKEAFRFAMDATGENFCIAEEFLQGTMFGAEAMISAGRLAYVLPLGNDLRDGNPPFPIGHFVPWDRGEEIRDQIGKLVLQAAKALGFDNCAMDLDCMLVDGEPYVIEATARAGATCITDTVSVYYGINYYEAIVKAALGIDVTDLFAKPKDQCRPNISRLLSAEKAGRVKSILLPNPLPEGVYDLSFNIGKGSQVRPMRNGRDRIGQLIVEGQTLDQCRSLQREVLDRIRLTYGETEEDGRDA